MPVNNLQELKALAVGAKNDCGDYVALNDYGMAIPPAVNIGLIEEIERLRAELSERAANAWRVIDAKASASPSTTKVLHRLLLNWALLLPPCVTSHLLAGSVAALQGMKVRAQLLR